MVIALTYSWWLTSNPVHFVVNLLATYTLGWIVTAVIAKWSATDTLKRSFLVTGSLVFTIGLLEMGALFEVIDYRELFRTPILAPWRSPAFRSDPELIYVRPPHERIRGSTVGGDFTFVYDAPDAEKHEFDLRYDHNGFRNVKDLSSAEVVLLGDSFLEGTYVPADTLLSARVSSVTGLSVVNLGLIGYGPRQQLHLLRRYALGLAPKTVVWLFFEGNDLKNIRTYDEMVASPSLQASHHSFWRRSFSRNALAALMRLVGDPKPSGLPRSGTVERSDGRRERAYFLYAGTPLSDVELHALGELQGVLADAQRLCAMHRIRMVVAFLPTKFRVYAPLLHLEPVSEAKSWTLNDLPERLRAVVESVSKQIGFIDLTPALQTAATSGRIP